MKYFSFLILLLIIGLLSCKKANPVTVSEYTNSDGYIIGGDPRDCACCGGWFVDINSDTMEIFNKTDTIGLMVQDKKLPVKVNLDWKKKTDGCLPWKTVILVDKINLK